MSVALLLLVFAQQPSTPAERYAAHVAKQRAATIASLERELPTLDKRLALVKKATLEPRTRQPPKIIDGGKPPVFATATARSKAIANLTAEIAAKEQLIADTRAGKADPKAVLKYDDLQLGAFGAISNEVLILQALSDKTALASIRQVIQSGTIGVTPRGGGPATVGKPTVFDEVLVFLELESPTALSDGMSWKPVGIFEVSGTRQYTTLAGTQKSVPRLTQFTPMK